MLRNFPPKNPILFDFSNNDVLSRLRSISSSIAEVKEQSQTSIPTTPYDSSILSDLTNQSTALMNATIGDAIPTDEPVPEDTTDSDLQTDAKSGNTKDEFILAMIFKIVPIGINIVKKGKTIARGFKELAMGIVNLLKNIALLTVVFGLDTINFGVQLFVFLFKLLLCSIKIISKFPKCIIFYIINILMLIILCFIISILFLFDVFLMVKYFTGTSCLEAFFMLLTLLEMLDKTIYSLFSFHIIHYPESILDMCYRCSMMGDTSGFELASSRMFNDLFVNLPNEIFGPIGEAISGIGHILSFLNLG